MPQHTARIYMVIGITLSRSMIAVLFTFIAFRVPPVWASVVYLTAMGTDFIDGYLSRRLKVVTEFGRLLDLVCDKCLTIVSMLYAANRGIALFPLALITTRETLALGVRLIAFGEGRLLPKNRLLSRLMVFVLWSNTLFLILIRDGASLKKAAVTLIYWCCAVIFTGMFVVRIWKNRQVISPFIT
jgi:CDP-diacylglycerol---glycerol-3-phosphate 3-phosphatidyltransferase